MKLLTERIPDVKLVEIGNSRDERGFFRKVYSENQDYSKIFQQDIKEIYYSQSCAGTVRGMHFQMPPYEHEKLVHVIQGKIVDVVVDLRKNSLSFQKHMAVELEAEDNMAVFIPVGFAHGFASLQDGTLVLYGVTSVYHPEYDSGIAYDSIGYNWNIRNPNLSERDRSFLPLSAFGSPF